MSVVLVPTYQPPASLAIFWVCTSLEVGGVGPGPSHRVLSAMGFLPAPRCPSLPQVPLAPAVGLLLALLPGLSLLCSVPEPDGVAQLGSAQHSLPAPPCSPHPQALCADTSWGFPTGPSLLACFSVPSSPNLLPNSRRTITSFTFLLWPQTDTF